MFSAPHTSLRLGKYMWRIILSAIRVALFGPGMVGGVYSYCDSSQGRSEFGFLLGLGERIDFLSSFSREYGLGLRRIREN